MADSLPLFPNDPVLLIAAIAGLAGLACLAWLWRRSARNRDLLRASLDASSRARQIVSADGRVIMATAAFRQIFGATDRPLPDILFGRIALGSDAGDILRQVVASVGNEGRGHAEIEIVEADGSSEWFDVSGQRLDEFGGARVWSTEIVTARRQIEEFIRSDHEKFADLVEHAPIGFYSVDDTGRFLFVNSTLAGWLGLKPDETGGYAQRLHDLLLDRPGESQPAFSPFANAETRGGEVMLKGPNGSGFQAYIRQDVAVMQPGPSGGPRLRTRSVVHDLTREAALEQALRVSEQYFRRFFEEAPTAIVLIDEGGRIEQVNQAFQAWLAPRRMQGEPFIDLVVPEDRSAAKVMFAEVLDSGQQRQPISVRLAGPSERSVTIYASRRDDKGRGIGLIAHLIDATEQKRLEVQFAQSQKMQAVGLLAGGIAHDFNNLLTAMIGFCDLLLLRHRAGDQSFADIMQIKQNANRAASLVRQLLAFSRQQTLQPRVLDITDILAELSHLLRRLIGENIELSMQHGRDLKPVRADAGQFEQVIINLAVNGRDAMPQGGKLSIRTENVVITAPMSRGPETMPEGAYVLIAIGDSGHGIAPDIVDRIFEPFFSTKAVGSGTGLGLSTVYGIVRQSGGFIFVDSAIEQGTTFRVYLPQYAGAVPGTAEHADDRSSDLTGIGTILLVEDEDAVRLFSARALRNKGYKVLEARSGEAALEIIGEQIESIDLVISDVVMPRMDGPTLIKDVRAKWPAMPVIFISGYAEDDFRRRIDTGEEAHFLMKPFTLKQLAAKVKEVLN
jgi:two-component system, cell cycle sensor histidine kinase and response regulator CckA